MTVDLKLLLRQDAGRREGKPLLRIPHLDEVRNQYCQEQVSRELKECARVIAGTGLLYRWRRYTGKVVLMIWNRESLQFNGFDIDLFAHWLGANFDLQDSKNMSFGLPAPAVAARISETLLSDESDLPWASWQLTDQYRRENK